MDLKPEHLINNFIIGEGDHGFESRFHCPYVNIDEIGKPVHQLWEQGITKCKLYVYVSDKREDASIGLDPDNIMVRAIKAIKDSEPRMQVMTEVCACAYSANGECVLLCDDGRHIDDQSTHDYVGQMAVLHAQAGCDVLVAGLTHDGSIRAMRKALDDNGFSDRPIMGSVQFRSAYYGPYRAMMNTEPEGGQTFRSHIGPDDVDRAVRLVKQFEEEGAELLTVQPAMPNVDMLVRLARETDKPIAAFSVSSELPCFTGPDRKLLPEKAPIMREYFYSLRRAGAATVATYLAADFARWLNEQPG